MTDFMRQIEEELRQDPELARLTQQEKLILDVTELVLEKMEDKDIAKSDLAGMLGTNKSHITQMLQGSRNMTLRTVSDIFFALDCKVKIDAVDIVNTAGSHMPIMDELRLRWLEETETEDAAGTTKQCNAAA
jgi:antitoxin component HigA of HigAB toxin-antitoxin module